MDKSRTGVTVQEMRVLIETFLVNSQDICMTQDITALSCFSDQNVGVRAFPAGWLAWAGALGL